MLWLGMFIGLGILLHATRPGESIDPPEPSDYVPTYHYLGF
jgi:hypothetical protein